MILFMDFAGTLHPADCVGPADPGLFSHPWCLDELVRYLPLSLSLVISSAWRRLRQLEELKWFFPPDI